MPRWIADIQNTSAQVGIVAQRGSEKKGKVSAVAVAVQTMETDTNRMTEDLWGLWGPSLCLLGLTLASPAAWVIFGFLGLFWEPLGAHFWPPGASSSVASGGSFWGSRGSFLGFVGAGSRRSPKRDTKGLKLLKIAGKHAF